MAVQNMTQERELFSDHDIVRMSRCVRKHRFTGKEANSPKSHALETHTEAAA